MSQKKDIQRLLDKFEQEKARLLTTGIFRKGSITKRRMTCGNPACKCKKDKRKRHGPYYWWTTKVKRKTKAILVQAEFLSEAKSYLKNHKRLQKNIDVLAQLSDRVIRKKLRSFKKSKT